MTNHQPQDSDTRARILEAAARVFAAKGYHDTHVDEIVTASQTSKGSVYFYFPSKQHIFFSLIDQFVELLEKRLNAALKQDIPGVARVDAALNICETTFGQYRTLAKIAFIQAVGLGAVFEEKRREINDRFANIIRAHLDRSVADGSLPALNTEVAARVWIGALNEIVLRWVYAGEPHPERVFPTLRLMLLRSVGVPEDNLHPPPSLNRGTTKSKFRLVEPLDSKLIY